MQVYKTVCHIPELEAYENPEATDWFNRLSFNIERDFKMPETFMQKLNRFFSFSLRPVFKKNNGSSSWLLWLFRLFEAKPVKQEGEKYSIF